MAWMGPVALAASLAVLALAWLTLPLPVVPPWPLTLAVLALALLAAARSQARGRPREAMWGGVAAIAVLTALFLKKAALWTYRTAVALDASPYLAADPKKLVRFTADAALALALVACAVLWRALEARAAGTPQVRPLVPGPARLPGLRLLKTAARRLKKLAADAAAPEAAPVLPPVVIGVGRDTGDPIEIPGVERFVHTLVLGPTGSGKTSKMLAPMVFQDLEKLAAGHKLGVTVVEPKGDFTDAVAAYLEE